MSETGTKDGHALHIPDLDDADDIISDVRDIPKTKKARGGNFFALDRDTWETLWRYKPANRLHFVIAYLVLLAGTGADHQFSKWSAKAIEEHVGIGKPRGQKAIQELIEHGLIAYAEDSTPMRPHYRLRPLDPEADPIYLPVALITGLNGETPILRRIRETGDAYALRMLVDLYGMVEGDVTHAPPISRAALFPVKPRPTQKAFEIGVHTVWRMELGWKRRVNGPWRTFHSRKGRSDDAFWQSLYRLEAIRAFKWADWVFEGPGDDAEPLFPLNDYAIQDKGVPAATLGVLAGYASDDLKDERYPHRKHENFDPDDEAEDEEDLDPSVRFVRVPLPCHHRRPVVRAVLSLTIEADTPQRRIAYGQRMARIKTYSEGFARIRKDASSGVVDRPLRAKTGTNVETETATMMR